MLGLNGWRTMDRTATAAALFLISVLYLILCMNPHVGPYDEGITLFGADRVLHGDVPHRDFYALYGPGQFYVLAGLYRLFGASVLVERAWTTAVSAGCVALIFLLVDKVASRRLAILAAVAALPWFQTTDIYGSAIIPCMAATLAGLIMLKPVFGRAGVTPRLLGAGACAGIVLLFRYDVGISVFGAECALLVVSTWFERPVAGCRLRAIALGLLVFGAGFAITVLPLVAAYAVNDVLPDLFFDVVVFPASAYARTRGLPLPRLWTLRSDPTEFIGVYLPLILCAAALAAMIAAVRAREQGLPWTLLALTLLEVIWFGKGFVRASVVQMTTALVMGAPLAAVAAQPPRGRGKIGTIVALVTTGALLIYLSETIVREPRALAAIAHNLADPPNCGAPAGLERMACFKMSPAEVETVQYVQQRTNPNDAIFIGLTHHDKIFFNDVTLCFAMNRPSATKWHHFDPGLQTSAAIQQDMIRELQRVRPKLIVLETIADSHEPNDSAVSSGVTSLDDYIFLAYIPAATFEPYIIMRPRP